jgi:DNA topoisomerase-1
VEKDLSGNTLNEPRVIATIISLMERTYIRIGNAEYEKSNGSYGLTTLHDRHVMIGTGNIRFAFKGKKGIFHNITLRNRKLARIVQQCRDIPGKELFQYYDDEGKRQPVDSGMVNRYIHEHLGEDFSAKDFRTWAGSLSLLRALQAVGMFDNVTECRHKINLALDDVSSKLGNTRTVCRKYYVHPGIIRLYEENQIQKYLDELDKIEAYDKKTGLTSDEKVLMRLLEEVS